MHPHHPRFLHKVSPYFSYSSWTYYTYDFACAVWAPSGDYVAVGGLSGRVVALSRSGEEVWRTRGVYSRKSGATARGGELWANIECIAFSHDGTRLVAGTFDHQVLLYDTQNGALLGHWKGRGSSVCILDVAFSPDGQHIAATTSKQRLCCWTVADLEAHKTPTWTVGVTSNASALLWTNDPNTIVFACEDGTLQARDITRRRTAITLAKDLGESVAFLHSPSLPALLTSTGVWSFDSEWSPAHTLPGTFVSVCRTGQHRAFFACLSADGYITLLNPHHETIDRWRVARWVWHPSVLAISPDNAVIALIHKTTDVLFIRVDDLGRTDPPLPNPPPNPTPHAFHTLPQNTRADARAWSQSDPLNWTTPGHILWHKLLAVAQTQRFIADDDHVYLGAAGGPCGAIHRHDGSSAWPGLPMRPIGGTSGQASVVWIAHQRVAISGQGMLCFQPDGRVLWRLHQHGLPGTNSCDWPFAIHDNTMWTSRLSSRLVCSLRDGTVLWGAPKDLHDGRGVALCERFTYTINANHELAQTAHGERFHQWAVPTNADTTHAPLWCGEDHLLLCGYSRLEMVAAHDGALVWKTKTPNKIEHVHVYQDTLVIVLLTTQRIIAFNSTDGTVRWDVPPPRKKRPKTTSKSPPVVHLTFTEHEILAPRDNHIAFISPLDGTIRITQDLGDRSITAPVVASHGVLFVACGRSLVAIGHTTPTPRDLPPSPPHRTPSWTTWSQRPPHRDNLYLRACDKHQIFAEDRVSLMALSPHTGDVLWRIPRGFSALSGTVVLRETSAFFISNLAYQVAQLLCVRRSDGATLWSLPLSGVYEPKVLRTHADHLYVGYQNDIVIIHLETLTLTARVHNIIDEHRPKHAPHPNGIITSHQDRLAAHNTRGELLWEDHCVGNILASNDHYVLLCDKNELQIRNTLDGEVVHATQCNTTMTLGALSTTHAVAASSSSMHGISLTSGKLLWSHGLPSTPPNILRIENDHILFNTSNSPTLTVYSCLDGSRQHTHTFTTHITGVHTHDTHAVVAQACGDLTSLHIHTPSSPQPLPPPLPFTAPPKPSRHSHTHNTAPSSAWIHPFGGVSKHIGGTCLLHNNTLVVASVDQGLTALDPCTGQRRWLYDSKTNILEVASTQTTLIARTSINTVLGLSLDGHMLWETHIPDIIETWVPGHGGVLVFGKTGTGYWIDQHGTLQGSCDYAMSVGPGRVHVDDVRQYAILHNNTKVAAFELQTGRMMWECAVPIAHDVYVGGVVVGDRFVIPGPDAKIYGLDLNTGDLCWKTCISGVNTIQGRPCVVGDDVLVGTYSYSKRDGGDAIVRLSAQDGSERWRTKNQGGLGGAPACTRQTILCGDDRYTIRALELESGAEVWRGTLCGDVFAPSHIVPHARGVVAVGYNLAEGFLWEV